MKNKELGITLINLIITIIILLILASTALIMIKEEINIFGIAKQTVEKSNESTNIEKILISLNDWKIKNQMENIDVVEYLSTTEGYKNVGYYDKTEGEIIFEIGDGQKFIVNTQNSKIDEITNTKVILDSNTIVVGIDEITQIRAKYDIEEGNLEWFNSNEDVVKITIEDNIAKFETIGTGNAVITAKLGDYVAQCEIMIPTMSNSTRITTISTGTREGLFRINELKQSGYRVGTLEITNNIDMKNIEWRPLVGSSMTINGNGYKISNLNCIQETSYGRSGFVGKGDYCTINNLTLENVTAIGTQAGAFMGHALEQGKIVDCKLTGNNVISWQQNTGNYQEDYSGIGALIGIPYTSSSHVSSAVIEGNVTIKYNNMSTKYVDIDETGALGFVSTKITSLDFHNIDTTNAIITKEGNWTQK